MAVLKGSDMKVKVLVIGTLFVSIEGIHRLFGVCWWSLSNEGTDE